MCTHTIWLGFIKNSQFVPLKIHHSSAVAFIRPLPVALQRAARNHSRADNTARPRYCSWSEGGQRERKRCGEAERGEGPSLFFHLELRQAVRLNYSAVFHVPPDITTACSQCLRLSHRLHAALDHNTNHHHTHATSKHAIISTVCSVKPHMPQNCVGTCCIRVGTNDFFFWKIMKMC